MNEREEQLRVNRGLAWVGAASAVTGVLNVAVIGVILALFVTPAEYGTAALALAAFPILDLATDMGLSAALIHSGDHSPARLSTIFWLNVAMVAVLIAVVLFALAPGLAALYEAPIVGEMLRLYCVKLLLQNIYYVPNAIMNRELRFPELSQIRVVANLVENLSLVALAAGGAGIWCFVYAPLARTLVLAVGIQRCRPWWPGLRFDWAATRDSLHFGLKTSLSRILFFVYTGVDSYVVGYWFGREALGLYRAACDLALDPSRVLGQVVVSVAFPAFSRARERPAALAGLFLHFARINFIIIATFLIGVVVAAPALLELLDARWVPAAPVARILCIAAVLRGLGMVVPPLLDSVGRPALTLQFMAVAAVTMPVCFVAAAALLGDRLGFAAVAWAWVVGYPIAFAVLLAFALGVLRMRLRSFVAAVARLLLWGVLAALAGLAVGWGLAGVVPALVGAAVSLAVAAAVYFGLLARCEGLGPASLRSALRPSSPGAEAGRTPKIA